MSHDAPGNGSGVGLSLRELVLEIRADVKALDEKIERIDRDGSIGTRALQADHETRIRGLEDSTAKWKYGIPPALIGSLGALFAALFGVRAN